MIDELTSPSLSSTRALDKPMTNIASQTGTEGAITRLMRRSILTLTRETSNVQDYLDLAELADAVGATDIASLVRNCGLLRKGVDSGETGKPLDAIARATAELRELIALDTGGMNVAPAETDAITACANLARLLTVPLDAAAEGELEGLLAGWHGLTKAAPVDPRADAGADLPVLLSTFARRELQSFLHRNHDLAFAPYGSPRLLHHAARLGIGGLGPFLSTVRNVIRSGRDVLGLIALASGDEATALVETWVVPLAGKLHAHQVSDLADELADLGLVAALRGLLTAALRRQDWAQPIRHLRDAALDLGDNALGWSAQQGLLALDPLSVSEWRRIGDMLATADDNEGAKAAFSYAIRLAPGDPDTLARLTALDAGEFGPYAVMGGFDTSRPRQLIRFARRAA